MSVAQDSSTERVYVRLLGEGTEVYRPVCAVRVGRDLARLAAPNDYDPHDEEWEFEPGSLVRLGSRVLEGTAVLVAVSLVE
jgi:hypothetical protein